MSMVFMLFAFAQSAAWAQITEQPDPPGRVARLNTVEGAVSISPSDSGAWSPAVLNRPLTTGDRLWATPGARAELHIGSTAVRMNGQTSLDFLTLDDTVTHLRLAQGTVKLRVHDLPDGQRLEINTPNLAFVITQPGDYRLDVNPASETTRVVAQAGSGMIYGDSGSPLTLGSQQQGSFTGTQLVPAAPGSSVQDSFDVWAAARDQREEQSVSARYVPREMVGYQQLDSYGDWSQDPSYGAVWLPRAVPANWAPYRAGHWNWITPWGWTWIDDAPWGFAPFHYGRWAQIGPRWAWVPGRLGPRPVYAPALVAFVGGGGGVNWNISAGSGGPPRPGVGWFPLAPGEAFRPAYRVSPRYITQVNNNIVVNNSVNITHVYRFQRQSSAVTAASTSDFAGGRPIRPDHYKPGAVDLDRAQLIGGGLSDGSVAGQGGRPRGGEGDKGALPPRPDSGEQARPAPVAASPPAAVLATRPVVASRGERRDDRQDNHRNIVAPDRSHSPMARAPVQATSPAAVPPVAPPAPAQIPAARLPELRQAPPAAAIAIPPGRNDPAAREDPGAIAERGAAAQAQRAALRAQQQAQQKAAGVDPHAAGATNPAAPTASDAAAARQARSAAADP
ncbi:MAG: chromosome partitioning protein ParA [Polaromonas sp.]|nr:chromosome partitioning protein ParA [Polaromonas sp.]